MIIDVHKFLIIGLKDHLDAFFEKAQEKGFMEFITIGKKRPVKTSDSVHELHSAIKVLRKLPVKTELEVECPKETLLNIAKQINDLKAEIERLYEEERVTEAEISRVFPLGYFSLEELHFIEKQAKRCIQFFCVSTSIEIPQEIASKLFYIHTEYDLHYYMSIETQPVFYPDMIEVKIEKSLGTLKNHLNFIRDTLRCLEAELKGFGGYIQHLQEALLEYMDEYALVEAKQGVSNPLTDSFFAIEAWVPENKVPFLHGMIGSLSVHIEQIAIEKDEKVPTYIENKGLSKIGEDIVKIYDIPSANDKDPSAWILWTFALFFSMIIADGGYGLIYLATALFFRSKLPNMKPSARRMVKLVKILGISCIIWGTLTMSFFGVTLKFNSPLLRFSVLHSIIEKKAEYHVAMQDCSIQELQGKYCKTGPKVIQEAHELLTVGATETESPVYEEFSKTILLEFSLLVGLVHVLISLLRYSLRNYANVGWILFAVGGYLYFPSFLNAVSFVQIMGIADQPTAYAIGFQLIIVGIATAMGLAIYQNKLKGLGEIANLVQIFADILSYLRLYALALASSIMAATFNNLGTTLGLVFGGIIILLGHGINFILCTMGGVIHGLRLNFIEWYHYSFEGGGRLFNPLRRLKTFKR